jgi:adenine-specific DNA-methyltransferase
MRTVLMVVAVFLLGGVAMAKEKKTVQDSRIGNLSKLRREQLSAKVSEIRSYLLEASVADTNAARLLSFVAELEKEVRSKKYGLIFEEHKERVDIELEENIPVLTENKKRFIDNGGEMNFLIEGDNLAALKLLEKTHRGKIDLIYIDPPYNTGNKDFIYNDSFVDKTDGYRHSKWLSFMEKRLKLAKSLMSSSGVIFISLNDIEQPNCRVLCDAIFGECNFCGQIIWRKKAGGGQTDDFFVTEHEYVLVYRKTKAFEWIDDTIVADAGFNKEDNGGKFKAVKLEKWGSSAHKEDRLTMWFPIKDPAGKKMYPVAPDGLPGRWRVGQKRMQDLEKNKLIYWEKKDGRWVPYEKIYSIDGNLSKIKKVKCRSIFYDEVGGTGDATDMLTEIFGKKDIFSNAKPVSLIEELLVHAKANFILDFFAGSGTTGHAVMKLNSEDGGKRKFILVTNNENGICEKVTYERLKRVIKRDKFAASVKYFKVGYVPIGQKVYEEYADDLLTHIRELVELENAIDFKSDSTIAIAVTQKDFEKFVSSDKKMDGKKALYVGHDVLIGKPPRQKLERMGIEIRIIPQYYYSEQEA